MEVRKHPFYADSFWESFYAEKCNRIGLSLKQHTTEVLVDPIKALDEVKAAIGLGRLERQNLWDENALLKKKLLEQNIRQQSNNRALYINLDGSMKYGAVVVMQEDLLAGYGPAREVKLDELLPGQMDEVFPGGRFDPSARVKHYRRHYRLAFSQGALHVYQELG